MNRRCRKRRINDGVIERWFAVNFSANDDTYYYYALFGLLNSPTRVILIPRLINRFRHRDVFHRSLLFISHSCQHCKLHDCTVHTHFGLKLIKKNIYLNFMANGGWPFFPHSFSQPIAAQPNTKLQFLSEPTTPFILLRLTPSLLLFVHVFFFISSNVCVAGDEEMHETPCRLQQQIRPFAVIKNLHRMGCGRRPSAHRTFAHSQVTKNSSRWCW